MITADELRQTADELDALVGGVPHESVARVRDAADRLEHLELEVSLLRLQVRVQHPTPSSPTLWIVGHEPRPPHMLAPQGALDRTEYRAACECGWQGIRVPTAHAATFDLIDNHLRPMGWKP